MRASCVLAAAIARAIALAIALAVVVQVESATAQSRVSDPELAKALQSGGHVVVMRHAQADPDKADTDPLNFKNIKAQQPLTEAGKASAKAFGEWLRAIGAPFSDVITSRYNRAYQTAVLAGFKDKEIKASADVTEGSPE